MVKRAKYMFKALLDFIANSSFTIVPDNIYWQVACQSIITPEPDELSQHISQTGMTAIKRKLSKYQIMRISYTYFVQSTSYQAACNQLCIPSCLKKFCKIL